VAATFEGTVSSVKIVAVSALSLTAWKYVFLQNISAKLHKQSNQFLFVKQNCGSGSKRLEPDPDI
jgi:hypothetical protein